MLSGLSYREQVHSVLCIYGLAVLSLHVCGMVFTLEDRSIFQLLL